MNRQTYREQRRAKIRKVHHTPHPGAIALAGFAVDTVWAGLAALGVDLAPVNILGFFGLLMLLGGLSTIYYRFTDRAKLRAAYGYGGWLTERDMKVNLGARTVRNEAHRMRSSLEHLTEVDLKKMHHGQFGLALGTTVTGPAIARRIYAGHKNVTLVLAPAQSGKTGLMGNWIIDHAGAVVSTSTKPDMVQHTSGLRAKRAADHGGQVFIFNPEGLGDVESTFRWSPTSGCDDQRVAQERASYLVSGVGEGDKNSRVWDNWAVGVLGPYLMAAALEGLGMGRVAQWVANPEDTEALEILRDKYPHIAPSQWIDRLEQAAHQMAPNTKMSVYFTLAQAVAFMGDPVVARTCDVQAGEPVFDVEAFLRGHSTLYLIGSDRKFGTIPPLLTALTGYIFEEAKRLASRLPKGRLDPPILFALDEVALIVPIPLPEWSADAGGRGICLAVATQGPAQLEHRWGKTGASTIRNNAVVKVVFGGMGNHDDLESISSVCGSRREDVISESLTDGHRVPSGVSRQLVRTLTTDRLRMIPAQHVLVLYRSAPPVITKITYVWDRQDVITQSMLSARVE